ncbi:hypothetical protein FRC17_008519 [Serendipita sp. 399]|nr:hypothetical protein FRC17_008519 [Serendipita sp. 399]
MFPCTNGFLMDIHHDHFLNGVACLALELSIDGGGVNRATLLSREATTGIWDADQVLILREVDKDFTLSVFLEVGIEDRQLLGYMDLSGLSLFDKLGEQFDVPLMGDGNMILKTTVEIMSPNDAPKFASGTGQGNGGSKETEIRNHFMNAADHFCDFEQSGNLDSLERAISNFQIVAGMISEDDPVRLHIANNLGGCLLYRFERLGDIEDLKESITQMETAVKLIPDSDPGKPDLLYNLGNSLQTRFEYLGGIDDIDSAIVRYQSATNLTPDHHPDKPDQLDNLGSALRARFEALGNTDDIDNSITQHEAALNLTSDGHPAKSSQLNNLGIAFRTRFDHLGNIADIDRAIAQHQAAVNLTPDKPHQLSSLGNSLSTRFSRFGNLDDINSAILQHQAAVELTPDDHPAKSCRLSNLGNSLAIRFERLGHVGDIDNAIARHQAAVDVLPNGHPGKPGRLSNIGNSLSTRYRRFGNITDLDRAIAQHQAAVHLTPDGHPDKPSRLSNLGSSLLDRFKRLRNIGDIDHAIAQLQTAINLTPDGHPDKPAKLTNLGNTLKARFKHLGNIGDIHDAIAQHRAALNLTPHDHPDKPRHLTSLGNSLSTRFERLGNLDDIDQSVEHHLLAVEITPLGHSEKPSRLHNLGSSFLARFRRVRHPRDAEAAISHFSAAAKSPIGPPSDRLLSAQLWIDIASIANHQSLLDAYDCALSLVPLVAWLGLSITNRHQHLIRMGNIARDAAATAISLQHFDKAVEWLEQGRSIVWTQILQLRTPVDQLHDVEPKLANELLRVSRLLDSGNQQNDAQVGGRLSPEEAGRQYRALAEEWEKIIKRVRELPDFEHFLRPPRLSRLLGAARNGPVVVVNITKERCDALALIDRIDEVMHIPLPNLTLEKAKELQEDLNNLLQSQGVRLRAIRINEFERGADGECKRILGELWESLVKPVMDSLAFSPHPDTLPRIWWCVNGPLAFLPIHAAGNYDEGSNDGQIHDYVISSYIPTLAALLGSPKVTPDAPFKMLSVIDPSSGRRAIPNTKVESAHIQRHFKDRDLVTLEGPNATRERVMDAMKDCQWLHLACHGSQNMTKSALKLHGGDLSLEQIIKLDFPQAEFAYLSACQTVAGEEALSEEAVHVAGGMLLAGYRSVVATMWSIQDKLAPEVADEFYAHLMEDGKRPDSRKTAEALHLSVQKLRRKSGIKMVSWIPFVHLGI